MPTPPLTEIICAIKHAINWADEIKDESNMLKIGLNGVLQYALYLKRKDDESIKMVGDIVMGKYNRAINNLADK